MADRGEGEKVTYRHYLTITLPVSLIMLCILLFWKWSYPHGCWALLAPLLMITFICKGQIDYLMQRRVCRVKCLFHPQSWIYALLTRKFFIGLYAFAFSSVLTLLLAGFVALAVPADALLIVIATLVTSICYPWFQKISEQHVNPEMKAVMAKRMAVLFTLFIMTMVYTLVMYFEVALPAYVDPTSWQKTVDMASQTVGSLCTVSNYYLKFVQESNATTYFALVTINQQTETGYIFLLWIFFFIKGALVFASLARLQVEMIGMALAFAKSESREFTDI